MMPEDVALLMERIGYTGRVEGQCHAVSLAIVQSGIYPGARVARGWAKGVPGQHSWVVADGGCYDLDSHIIDATLWSYDATVDRVWQGTYRDEVHVPHGKGHFMTGERPYDHGDGEAIALTPKTPLSADAMLWLSMVLPLDYRGWHMVANLPVEGWPAGEILAAMDDTDRLSALVPIDRLGMLTDRNPGGLYLRSDA